MNHNFNIFQLKDPDKESITTSDEIDDKDDLFGHDTISNEEQSDYEYESDSDVSFISVCMHIKYV